MSTISQGTLIANFQNLEGKSLRLLSFRPLTQKNGCREEALESTSSDVLSQRWKRRNMPLAVSEGPLPIVLIHWPNQTRSHWRFLQILSWAYQLASPWCSFPLISSGLSRVTFERDRHVSTLIILFRFRFFIIMGKNYKRTYVFHFLHEVANLFCLESGVFSLLFQTNA